MSGAVATWFTEQRARRNGWWIIALAVLVVYWPLSTFRYATDGGDTFDCWLAWRHFITLALQNGELPVWNPLQQMGYPVYADLQGPAWYPESIAIGGTIGHSIWTLQTLYLAYLIVGGIGAMRLSVAVHGDARIGTAIGLAYSLCGFLASRQMHFYAIISAAWMPWFLAAQIDLMRVPTWRNALAAAVAMMLLLTGGNHTFTIIAAYLLPPLFAVHALRAGGGRRLIALISHEALFLAFTLVLACGTMYAWIEVSPFLGRMRGLPYALSSEGATNLTTLPTLMFPALFGKSDWSLGTHPAMANSYMGVLMLALATIALLRKRTAIENVFAVFGLICLLLSFADDLPFHRFAWRWLPGLNVFRFPTYYLYFTLLAVLILAGGSLKEDAAWRFGAQRSLLIGVGSAFLVGTALLLFLPDRVPVGDGEMLRRSLFERARALSYKERMFLGWCAIALTSVAALWSIRRHGKLTSWTVLILVLVEMGWNTHLAIWNSAVSDLDPGAIASRIAPLPKGPVVPRMEPLAWNHDKGEALHLLWQNTQTFLGSPSREGFNSFWPSHTDSLLNQYPDLAKAMDRQPMVYLTDRLVRSSRPELTPVDSASVFVNGEIPGDLQRSPGDTVSFLDLHYGRFTLRTHTGHATFLMVQQTWFPGWTIQVDDTPLEPVRANMAAFGAVIPAGDHRVDIRFEKPLLPWLMGISMTGFVMALVALSWAGPAHRRTLALTGSGLVGGLIAWSLLAHTQRTATERPFQAVNHALRSGPEDVLLYSSPPAQPSLLYKGHDFTPAFNARTGDLLGKGYRSLIVDLDLRAHGRCMGLLVFHRTVRGKTTDYEAVRLVSADTLGHHPITWSVARDLRELRYPDEDLAIYVWNQGPDTMSVTDLHVRLSPREAWKE